MLSEYDIILIILGVVVPIISALTAYKKFKSKLNQIRHLIDSVDDAIYDDEISEDEFRFVWSKFLNVIQHSDKKTPGV